MQTKMVWRTPSIGDRHHEDIEGIGNLRQVGDSVYRWVENKETAVSHALGAVVCHKFADGANMFKNVYQAGAGSGDIEILAGVVTVTEGLAAATGTNPKKYGWIQVLGYCATISMLGNTTGATPTALLAGMYMKAVDAQSYCAYDAALTTHPNYRRNIRLAQTIASAETPAAANAAGWVNCLEQ